MMSDSKSPDADKAPAFTLWGDMIAGVSNFWASVYSGIYLGPYNPIEIAQTWNAIAKWQQDIIVNYWVTAFKPVMRYYAELQVNAWLEKDAREHTVDDRTSAGGRYYTSMKNKMQSSLDFFIEPVQVFLKDQLMNNPELQARMRDTLMAEQFEMVDSIIRKRYPNDHGELFDDQQYNHKFLAEKRPRHKKDGDIEAVADSRIVDLFKKPAPDAATLGKDYPHIIITFSHAQGETLKDVRSITHGIEAQAFHSEGKKLPLGYFDDGEEINRGHTVVLYACDVEETPWRNGAALLRRINELKRIEKTGEPDREFNEVSPGAKRVAKLMLKCMAENPAEIDVDAPDSLEKIMVAKAPIRLRADAVHIANHFQLVGYSKGGNVASDAMRYLIHELAATHDGQSVFADHNGQGMDKKHIRSIVRSIATMALASVEVGLSKYDKDYGFRRVSVNNQKDLISAHHNYEHAANDERYLVKGNDEQLGHAPPDFLGSRTPEEERVSEEFEYRVGYAINDSGVKRRMEEFYAPHYGKAAISAVHFDDKGGLLFETAPGTTDAQMSIPKRIECIKIALQQKGLMGISIEQDHDNPGFFKLVSGNTNFAVNARALGHLKDAFEALKMDPNNELVIANSIIEQDIGPRLEALGHGRRVA